MNKQYTLKSTNSDIEAVKSKIIQDLNQRIGARQDCKVIITPLDFRSMNALRAYWVLIGSIVKWDADNHGYKADVWDQWFKIEAGLTEKTDLMPLWEMKYQLKIKEGWKITETIWMDTEECFVLLNDNDTDDVEWDELAKMSEDYVIWLAKDRFFTKTRSISNKGDVTKDEMSRLLMTVLKFGAENEVPDCFIADLELQNMLKSYER